MNNEEQSVQKNDNESTSNLKKDLITGKQTPEDMAAAFFTMEQPKLKNLIDNMSLRQLKRLFFNVVSYPFVKEEYSLNSKEEKSAFYIADQMIMNKTIMQLHLEIEKADKAQQTEVANLKLTEEQTPLQGEQTNG